MIVGKQFPLSEIFSDSFDFIIPSYQRPFSWTVEQAGELYSDLLSSWRANENEEYFLGSIVLIKAEHNPRAEVVDGQQRLTTLTMLLAAIATRFGDERQASLLKRLRGQGDALEGRRDRPRLTLRERDAEFFSNVQRLNFEAIDNADDARLSDAQINIKRICAEFRRRIDEDFPFEDEDNEKLFSFARYVNNKSYIVGVSTPNEDSAFRVFTVLNSRGLDLRPSDLLKASLIGNLDEEERERYTESWETLENDIGREKFNDLFGHIRMILSKVKQRKNIVSELQGILTERQINPRVFIDSYLEPLGEAFNRVINAEHTSVADPTRINNLLVWLSRIDNSDWIPPAIAYYRSNNNDEELLRFFTGLEKLAAYMCLSRTGINARIRRYGEVLNRIEHGEVLKEDSQLWLTQQEKNEMIDIASGEVYKMQNNPRKYLLLRLDSLIADAGAIYDHDVVSIEHVLPQTLNRRYWDAADWSDEDHSEWLHRLGNLILLSSNRNRAMRNYDFKTKKEGYFMINGVTTFALSTSIVNQDVWTPETVRERQEKLIDVLRKRWID
ncbi:DUF262 domain-containing HNH endonuclease family protein [Candidatus Micrarchaeota archaeon]|jgi:hypothetical protein|nr:DUF262 domain-containing HNH endonuclease family protein [Candidatus Micrarchaeota archaeon]